MPRVDVVASTTHYLDHLAPVWKALRPNERGHVITRPHLEGYAERLGMASHAETKSEHTHVLIAGWQDADSTHMWDNLVLMEHGVGQTYRDATASYAGGAGRDAVSLFLCQNDRVAEANAADGETIVVGDPYLDRLEREVSVPAIPKIFDACFSWHWNCDIWPETLYAWPYFRAEILRLRHGTDLTVAGTAHPTVWRDLHAWYKLNEIYSVRALPLALSLGRVFVADNTSAMWYALALGIPVVFLNPPWYRREVEHGLRFWEFSDAGWQVDNPIDLEPAIRAALTDSQSAQERAREVSAELFPHRDGKSAERAAEALRVTF